MKCVGNRKRSTNNSDPTCKRIRHRKNEESFSCEMHQRSQYKAAKSSFCEHHVMNTSLLQGEKLRQEFVKRLIQPRATNICSVINGSDVATNKASVDMCHHDNLNCNHLNKVQLLW